MDKIKYVCHIILHVTVVVIFISLSMGAWLVNWHSNTSGKRFCNTSTKSNHLASNNEYICIVSFLSFYIFF